MKRSWSSAQKRMAEQAIDLQELASRIDAVERAVESLVPAMNPNYLAMLDNVNRLIGDVRLSAGVTKGV